MYKTVCLLVENVEAIVQVIGQRHYRFLGVAKVALQ
jgi:hypothetical protein